jgi:cation diffusion facilitator family transporter
MTAKTHTHESPQQRTALTSVAAAGFLVLLKLVAGLASGSLGLLAEAAHSATDFGAALLTFFAIRVADRPADSGHPYGHRKAEHLAALGEGSFLIVMSGVIIFESISRITDSQAHPVETNWWVFAVIAVVLVVDCTRTVISWRGARAFSSAALGANALHFASDFVGTLAVLVGLLMVRAGVADADSIAALVVAVLVVGAAVTLIRSNVGSLMDQAPAGLVELAQVAIDGVEPPVEIRRLRVREAGGSTFVDGVLEVEADAPVQQGHDLADRVEAALHKRIPGSDVTIHIEPREGAELRERVTGAALSTPDVREVHNVRIVNVDGRADLSLHAKLPAGQSLSDAHAVVDNIEAAIRAAAPEIDGVHVHIEPLETGIDAPVPALAETAELHTAVARIVTDRTGSEPSQLRVYREPRGVVALVTISLPGEQSLAQAHLTATDLEAAIRESDPQIVDVVIHTEPAG